MGWVRSANQSPEDQAVVLDFQELPVVGQVQKSRKQLENEAEMCAVKVPATM